MWSAERGRVRLSIEGTMTVDTQKKKLHRLSHSWRLSVLRSRRVTVVFESLLANVGILIT